MTIDSQKVKNDTDQTRPFTTATSTSSAYQGAKSTAEPAVTNNSTTSTNATRQEPTMEPMTEAKIDRTSKAQQTVRNYSIGAMAVGLVPVPLVDLAALTALQLKMAHSLAKQYEVPFSEDVVRPLITSLIGGVVPTVAAMPLGSLIKIVPVVGQASGFISMATMGGAATYAVGKIFVQHFESGGTFLDFKPDKVKTHFKTLYEEGKQFVTRQPATSSSK